MHWKIRSRRGLLLAGLVVLVCSTSNTEAWTITSPTLNQVITFQSTPKKVSVAGTATVGESANLVGIFDPGTNTQISQTTVAVTSGAAAPHNWSGDVTLSSWPPNAGTNTQPIVKVCTGNPRPSINGLI